MKSRWRTVAHLPEKDETGREPVRDPASEPDASVARKLEKAAAEARGPREEPEPTRGDLAEDELPDNPTDLPGASWRAAVKRTFTEFQKDGLSDWAAALTYYGVLSIFPAMLVFVSLVGLTGRDNIESLKGNLSTLGPGSVRQLLTDMLDELGRSRGGAGLVTVLGLLGALWSASGYVAAFMRASNVVFDVEEGRPLWKTLPIRVGVTLVTLVLLSASAVAVVVSGPIAKEVGGWLGMGNAAVLVWNIAKWPVLLLVVALLFALLYWASPNVKQGFRWLTPGSVLALVVALVASGGFAVYVANFGSYNKTYGSLAGIIVFLVWLWIMNTAILLGAELNAELERSRAIAAGLPPDAEPYVEPRQAPDDDDGGGS